MQITMGINESALFEWIEYRKEKGKPLSNLALKKTQNLLSKYSEDHQQIMVDAAIMNDWKGLHVVEEAVQTSRHTSLLHDLTDTSWAH